MHTPLKIKKISKMWTSHSKKSHKFRLYFFGLIQRYNMDVECVEVFSIETCLMERLGGYVLQLYSQGLKSVVQINSSSKLKYSKHTKIYLYIVCKLGFINLKIPIQLVFNSIRKTNACSLLASLVRTVVLLSDRVTLTGTMRQNMRAWLLPHDK